MNIIQFMHSSFALDVLKPHPRINIQPPAPLSFSPRRLAQEDFIQEIENQPPFTYLTHPPNSQDTLCLFILIFRAQDFFSPLSFSALASLLLIQSPARHRSPFP